MFIDDEALQFAEDAQDLFLLRQAKAEDDGGRISLAEVETRLGLSSEEQRVTIEETVVQMRELSPERQREVLDIRLAS